MSAGKCQLCEKQRERSKVVQSCNGHQITWKACSACESYLRDNHKVVS